MGLFDKKKPPEEPVHPVVNDEASAPGAKIVIEMVAPPTGAVRAPGVSVVSPPETPRYTIQQAIELWRSLPEGSSELVGQVVKRTLESMNIRVETIVQDAVRKQVDLQGRINRLSKDLADLEHEMTQRRGELLQLEVEYRETTMVKERLLQSDRTEAPRPEEAQRPAEAPLPQSATSPTSGLALPKLGPGLAGVLGKAATMVAPRPGGK